MLILLLRRRHIYFISLYEKYACFCCRCIIHILMLSLYFDIVTMLIFAIFDAYFFIAAAIHDAILMPLHAISLIRADAMPFIFAARLLMLPCHYAFIFAWCHYFLMMLYFSIIDIIISDTPLIFDAIADNIISSWYYYYWLLPLTLSFTITLLSFFRRLRCYWWCFDILHAIYWWLFIFLDAFASRLIRYAFADALFSIEAMLPYYAMPLPFWCHPCHDFHDYFTPMLSISMIFSFFRWLLPDAFSFRRLCHCLRAPLMPCFLMMLTLMPLLCHIFISPLFWCHFDYFALFIDAAFITPLLIFAMLTLMPFSFRFRYYADIFCAISLIYTLIIFACQRCWYFIFAALRHVIFFYFQLLIISLFFFISLSPYFRCCWCCCRAADAASAFATPTSSSISLWCLHTSSDFPLLLIIIDAFIADDFCFLSCFSLIFIFAADTLSPLITHARLWSPPQPYLPPPDRLLLPLSSFIPQIARLIHFHTSPSFTCLLFIIADACFRCAFAPFSLSIHFLSFSLSFIIFRHFRFSFLCCCRWLRWLFSLFALIYFLSPAFFRFSSPLLLLLSLFMPDYELSLITFDFLDFAFSSLSLLFFHFADTLAFSRFRGFWFLPLAMIFAYADTPRYLLMLSYFFSRLPCILFFRFRCHISPLILLLPYYCWLSLPIFFRCRLILFYLLMFAARQKMPRYCCWRFARTHRLRAYAFVYADMPRHDAISITMLLMPPLVAVYATLRRCCHWCHIARCWLLRRRAMICRFYVFTLYYAIFDWCLPCLRRYYAVFRFSLHFIFSRCHAAAEKIFMPLRLALPPFSIAACRRWCQLLLLSATRHATLLQFSSTPRFCRFDADADCCLLMAAMSLFYTPLPLRHAAAMLLAASAAAMLLIVSLRCWCRCWCVYFRQRVRRYERYDACYRWYAAAIFRWWLPLIDDYRWLLLLILILPCFHCFTRHWWFWCHYDGFRCHFFISTCYWLFFLRFDLHCHNMPFLSLHIFAIAATLPLRWWWLRHAPRRDAAAFWCSMLMRHAMIHATLYATPLFITYAALPLRHWFLFAFIDFRCHYWLSLLMLPCWLFSPLRCYIDAFRHFRFSMLISWFAFFDFFFLFHFAMPWWYAMMPFSRAFAFDLLISFYAVARWCWCWLFTLMRHAWCRFSLSPMLFRHIRWLARVTPLFSSFADGAVLPSWLMLFIAFAFIISLSLLIRQRHWLIFDIDISLLLSYMLSAWYWLIAVSALPRYFSPSMLMLIMAYCCHAAIYDAADATADIFLFAMPLLLLFSPLSLLRYCWYFHAAVDIFAAMRRFHLCWYADDLPSSLISMFSFITLFDAISIALSFSPCHASSCHTLYAIRWYFFLLYLRHADYFLSALRFRWYMPLFWCFSYAFLCRSFLLSWLFCHVAASAHICATCCVADAIMLSSCFLFSDAYAIFSPIFRFHWCALLQYLFRYADAMFDFFAFSLISFFFCHLFSA